MKTILSLSRAGLLSVMFAFAACLGFGAPQYTMHAAAGIFSVSLLTSFMAPGAILSAGINVSDIVSELGSYFRTNNQEIRSMVYNKPAVLNYTKKLTKVKGKFPAPHSVTGHLVQGFASTWNAVGDTQFKVNDLQAYHQKVNYGFKPSDVHNSWLAYLYAEKLKPVDMPISKYIMEKELMARVPQDINYLCGKGVYDSGDLATFGKSMNGLDKVLTDGLASGNMYKIPVDTITDSNIVSVVETFEDRIPEQLKPMIDKIYMSKQNRDKYRRNYRDLYGAHNDFSKNQMTMTYSGEREIIGLDCLNGKNHIFATPDTNFLSLIDENEAPSVTDIQVADYTVKVFMEFWLGINFWTNEMVCAAVTNGSGSGLAIDNDTYFG